jgi:glycosyltransferase involved in cell wall biosynthesis
MPRSTALVGREGTIVSENIRSFSRLPALWFAGYRLLYPRFDAVVCQSRYMERDLVEHHGLPRDKTVVINNPIDLERIARGLPATRRPRRALGEPLRLVAAGRFAREKGYDLLLDALAELRDLRPTLRILGDGPLVPAVKQRAAELGLADAVQLVGFQPNPIPYFADADAFVLSSRYEGFPNVVLEALACDIGVIATPALGGTPEILEGVAGCELASAISAPALAAAIRAWASRPFPGIAPAVLERYRGSAIAERYAALFERVCAARQQR